MKISPNALCPCHSGTKYKKCCRPLHEGHIPTTPTALMRSRYSAYALNNADYIIKSAHLDNPNRQPNEDQWRKEILAFCEATVFVGLEILVEESGDSADEGYVTFKAILTQGTQDASFSERSLFKKDGEYWQYVSGERT